MADKIDPSISLNADISPFQQKMREAGAQLQKFGQAGEQAFSRMSGPLGALNSKFGALGAAISISGLGLFAKQAIDAADNLGKLSQKVGISVEDLAGFQHAASLSDISLEQFAQGVKQLSKYMGEHGDKLKAAGITATDAKGALIQLADAFQQMRDGPQKTALAMELLGRAGADMIPLLNGGGAALRAMMEEGRRLNPVTEEMSKQAEEFNDSLTRLSAKASAVGMAIAKDMLPHLMEFTSRLQQATESGLVDGFVTRWKAAFMGLAAAINEAGAASAEFLAKITFGSVAQNHMRQALTMRESAKRFYQEMAEMGRPKQGEKPAPSNSSSPSPGKTNLASLLGGSKEKKDKADPSFMQYYEAALAEEKRLAAERDGLREYTKAEELAFWQTVIDNATLSVNDRVAVVRKASALEVDVRRQSARQQQALDDETRRFGEQYALNEIEAQRAAADASLSLGQINKEQRLQLDAQYEQQRYEIQRTYLEARLSLLERDPETNAVEMAKIKNQLLEAEQNYQLRRSEILHGVVTEQGAVWNSFTDLLSGLWDKGISAMMNGTLTWRNAMRAVLSEMAQWFITDYVGKKVKAWLLGEATQTAVTKAGTAERAAVEGVAALKSVALWAWTAGKNIMASAWEAMAAAWKAIVGIPVIGPVLAPVAAAAAFAGVSRLAKNVASAEGGYDIPKGLNPLTQLHEEEMVLPQKYANVLRGLAGGGEGTVSPAPTSVQNITISAVDARSFRDYLKSNSHALAPGLRQLARNFTPVKGRF